MNKKLLQTISIILLTLIIITPNLSFVQAEENTITDFDIMTGKLSFSDEEGPVRSKVSFKAEGLAPNKPTQLVWLTKDGSYEIEGINNFIGPLYTNKEVILLEGKADSKGNWSGEFTVPEGFGGDHTTYVRQAGDNVAQSNYFVEPTFTMTPKSGPIGTEITIVAEGIGWSKMESNWQLTYDNKMTGLISAVSTEGKAVAKIRAAGPVGKHTLTVWHGYLGMPYINHQQAPTSYLPVPTFTFEVTDEKPNMKNFVEKDPVAADGGVKMAEPKNKEGVSVLLSQDEGTVGEQIELTAEGLPVNKVVELVWTTMVGNRISGAGFSEKQKLLGQALTDENGELAYQFPIPDDLGGVPHRIDLVTNGEVYGQTYLSINPSIISISPKSGPAGTEITVEIKGVGWTEYDNAYYLTYDNAYMGYMCGFNTQGTVKFTMIASGEPGYHLIDLYPGIYKGDKRTPDIFLAPQLTYGADHPGSAIPAIRMGFEITE